MSIDELKHKERMLRACFIDKLTFLNVDGHNEPQIVRNVKMYGALWHYTHQLLLAETNEESIPGVTTAETMSIQATGLTMKK